MTPYFGAYLMQYKCLVRCPRVCESALLRTVGCDLHPLCVLLRRSGIQIVSPWRKALSSIFIAFSMDLRRLKSARCRFGPYVKVLTGTHVYAQSVLRRGPE